MLKISECLDSIDYVMVSIIAACKLDANTTTDEFKYAPDLFLTDAFKHIPELFFSN